MRLKLNHATQVIRGELTITGSKSESNRILVLKALYRSEERRVGKECER